MSSGSEPTTPFKAEILAVDRSEKDCSEALPGEIEIRNNLFLAAIATLTGVFWTVLIFQLGLFQALAGWFWQQNDKPLPHWWLIFFVLAASIAVIAMVIKKPGHVKWNLLMLTLLGYVAQMSFGYMEGRGIDGIRDRTVHTGHAEFARIASYQTQMLFVAKNYESMIQSDQLGTYPRSKPPGQLLLYMATEKLSRLFSPLFPKADRFALLATFAAFFYPLLTYLAIIPLFFLSRLFLNDKYAWMPPILYLFFPNVTLITLHLDQVIYPTLFALSLWTAIHSLQEDNFATAILAGGIAYLSVYVSFSLLAAVQVFFFYAFLHAVAARLAPDADNRVLWRHFRTLAGFCAGFAILWATFLVLLNYDMVTRYANAMAFHHSWRGWIPVPREVVLYALVGYLDFGCWIGIPVAVLWFDDLFFTLADLVRRKATDVNVFSISLSCAMIAVGFLGKTKGEFGRLWLFFAPAVCLVAVKALSNRFKGEFRSPFVSSWPCNSPPSSSSRDTRTFNNCASPGLVRSPWSDRRIHDGRNAHIVMRHRSALRLAGRTPFFNGWSGWVREDTASSRLPKARESFPMSTPK